MMLGKKHRIFRLKMLVHNYCLVEVIKKTRGNHHEGEGESSIFTYFCRWYKWHSTSITTTHHQK